MGMWENDVGCLQGRKLGEISDAEEMHPGAVDEAHRPGVGAIGGG